MTLSRLAGEEQSRVTAEVAQLIQAVRVAQVMYAAVDLSLPDLLAAQPRTPEELAAAVGADPATLNRLLRAMRAAQLVALAENGCVTLTARGSVLRSDVPSGLATRLLVQLHESRMRPWGRLAESVQTGQGVFAPIFGMTMWEYQAQHRAVGALFDQQMTATAQAQQHAAVVGAYDFRRFATLVDVGGGHGEFLRVILQVAPDARGVLFDQADVVRGAIDPGTELSRADRWTVRAGDFFDAVPTGGDAYLLKRVLHDWDDDHAIAILRTIHRAMPPSGTLLVIDRVLPEDQDIEIGDAVADLTMLVMFGGQERTQGDFTALLAAAGFILQRVIPTHSPLSIVESVRQ
jgi:hypothetical protein